MKPVKVSVILIAILCILCLSANLVHAVGFSDNSEQEPLKSHKGDNLAHWLEDFQWLGFAFEDWSFGSNPAESGKTLGFEKLLFFVRHPKGNLQPYISIAPGLIKSYDGYSLDFNSSGVLVGLSLSF